MAFSHFFLAAVLAISNSFVLATPPPKGQPDCAKIVGDIASVNAGSAHPLYFCDFYLSRTRALTPFPTLTRDRTWAACECIAAAKVSTPKPFTPAKLAPGDTYATGCSLPHISTVESNFKNAVGFCNFFLAWSLASTETPIKSLSNGDATKACQCLLHPIPPKSTSSKSTAKATSAGAVCSAADVKSLEADPAATAFCQSVLKVSTRTAFVTVTAHTVTSDRVAPMTVTQMSYVDELSSVTKLSTSTVVSIDPNFICYESVGAIKKRSAPLPIPTYFTDTQAAHLSAACKCLGALGSSLAMTRTSTITVPTATIVRSIPTTDIDYMSSTSYVPTIVATIVSTYIQVEPSMVPYPTQDYTFTTAARNGIPLTDSYIVIPTAVPVGLSIYPIETCSCSGGNYTCSANSDFTPALQANCSTINDVCMGICLSFDASTDAPCRSAAVYPSNDTCVLYHTEYFENPNTCGYVTPDVDWLVRLGNL